MGTFGKLGAIAALVAGVLGACAPAEDLKQKQIDQAIIADLRERRVLKQVNEENEAAARLQETAVVSTEVEIQNPIATANAPEDVCPGIPNNPTAEQKYRAVSSLYDCFRSLLEPAQAWDDAAAAFRKLVVTQEPFSGLTLNLVRPRIERLPEALRREFLPAELDELMAIYKKRREAYSVVEKKVFEALKKHEAWLNTVSLPNMKGLLSLMRNDGLVDRQISELGTILGTQPNADWKKYVPGQYITPYGFASLIPSVRDEMSTLVIRGQTPFDQLVSKAALLETLSTQERITRGFYETMRASDPMQADVTTLPGRVAPGPNAVRVAFLDTGIDYKKLPALGRYLALGGTGFTSADYSDSDENPWEPLGLVNSLGHGTGTTSSMLTVLSDLNDGLLTGGRLSLAVWKVFTNRSVLAGPFQPLSSLWDNRPASVTDALIGELSKPVLPQVISMSLGFTSWTFLSTRAPNLLTRSTSLFVMAAGNQGAKVEDAPLYSSCFRDVPLANRPVDRILCVGALKRGVTQDDTAVASYSNYGDLVDVYTLESYYTDVCANGTSCATPVMSAMAAAVFDRFPTLTSAQVKRAIVAASVEKEFHVEGRAEMRKVRYFNPYLHYAKLMEEAQKLATPMLADASASSAGSGGRGE